MDQEILENLSTAVSNGRTDIVRSLLCMCESGAAGSNGANVDGENLLCAKILMKQCNTAGTLLHLATKLDHVDIVRTLLSSGAQPDLENLHGETAFDLVQSQSMTAVYVDELLKCSAKSEINRIQQLVNAGVDVNSQDSPESRNTALHWAVCFGRPEAVQCLLALRASPNVVNGQGVTPLHEAVKRKNIAIIKSLLSSHADPLLKSSKGKYFNKSPLDIAEGNEEISSVLLEFVSRDSESERSIDDSPSEQSPQNQLENLSSSLQSLSTMSEPSLKNASTYTPQACVHIPPFLTSPLPLITDSKLHLLWPQPQKIFQTNEEFFRLQPRLSVQVIHSSTDVSVLSVLEVWEIHSKRFKELGSECVVENIIQSNTESSADIICYLNSQMFSRLQSYKLIISKHNIRILCSDLLGLHYALDTLQQLFTLYEEDSTIPTLFIHDWPQIQHRAVLLDFTYGARKPTLETLKEYIKIMSLLKLNELHCYFKYDQNSGNCLPFSNLLMTNLGIIKICVKMVRAKPHFLILEFKKVLKHFAEKSIHSLIPGLDVDIHVQDLTQDHKFIDAFVVREFIELSKFCSKHFVTLVPAIDVDANEKHITVKDCITEPAHQLLSLFSSKSIQIGPNLSKVILQEILVSKNSKIIWDMLLLPTTTQIFLCYNSIVQQSCDWLQLLPLNCILIDYGYSVEHDYDYNVKAITHSGLNVCIGTGTTAWGSIAGSPENAIACVYKASSVASQHGSFGMIVADWQIRPHHPSFCFSWPGILLSLGMSWNSSVHEDYLHSRLPELLNYYVYQDSAQISGYLNVELGRLEAFMHQSVYRHLQESSLSSTCKSSVMHQLLIDADAVILDNFTFELIQQVIRHLRKFEIELRKAEPACFQHGAVTLELKLAMDLLLFACRLSKVLITNGANPTGNTCGLAVINVGVSNLPPIARTDIANRVLEVSEQFRAVWLSQNQICGLQASLTLFNSLLAKLIPEDDESRYSIDRNSPLLQNIYSSIEGAREV